MNRCRHLYLIATTLMLISTTLSSLTRPADASATSRPAFTDENSSATAYGRIPAGSRRPLRIPSHARLDRRRQQPSARNTEGSHRAHRHDAEVTDATVIATSRRPRTSRLLRRRRPHRRPRQLSTSPASRGTDRLELIKVKDGKDEPLDFAKPVTDVEHAADRPGHAQAIPRRRAVAAVADACSGDVLTAQRLRRRGRRAGAAGRRRRGVRRRPARPVLHALRRRRVVPRSTRSSRSTRSRRRERDRKRNAEIAAISRRLLRSSSRTGRSTSSTRRARSSGDGYDVVVAGGGTGGWAAAVQAARLGLPRAAAGRDRLDRRADGRRRPSRPWTRTALYGKFPVRERGIYREFHESMVAYYQTLDKDPFVAYYSYPRSGTKAATSPRPPGRCCTA